MKTDHTNPFHIIWLQLIKTIQSTSIERFEDLKASIKRCHPSQYAGENLEFLAADFCKDARELTTAGQYDHNLTLTMLKIFLLAGGPGNEDYRFPLCSTKQKLDQALLDIGDKEKSGVQAHMVAEKLTYQDICRQAEDVYRTQYDGRNGHPPVMHLMLVPQQPPSGMLQRQLLHQSHEPKSLPSSILRHQEPTIIKRAIATNAASPVITGLTSVRKTRTPTVEMSHPVEIVTDLNVPTNRSCGAQLHLQLEQQIPRK